MCLCRKVIRETQGIRGDQLFNSADNDTTAGNTVDRRETITLAGNLGAEGIRRQFLMQLDKIWESGSENLEIDMAGVSKLDFDSLTELLKARNRFLQAGTNVELTNIPDHALRVLEFFRVPVNKRS